MSVKRAFKTLFEIIIRDIKAKNTVKRIQELKLKNISQYYPKTTIFYSDEKLIALKEQLAHKAENRKPRVNKEKLELADKVVAIMEVGIAYRTAELAKILGVSTQKLTPALGVAVENGTVAKTIEKRVAKYTRAVE